MQHNNIEKELLRSFTDSENFDTITLQKMEAYGQKYPWFGLSTILGAKAAVETEVDSTLFSKTGIFCSKPIWLAGFLSKTKVVLQNEIPVVNVKEERFSLNNLEELKNEVSSNVAINEAGVNIKENASFEGAINKAEDEIIKEQSNKSNLEIKTAVLPSLEITNEFIKSELEETKENVESNLIKEVKNADVDSKLNESSLDDENDLVVLNEISNKNTIEIISEHKINVESSIEKPEIEEIELEGKLLIKESNIVLKEENENTNALASALALAEDQVLPIHAENRVEKVEEVEKDLTEPIEMEQVTNIAAEQYDYDAAQSFDIPALPTQQVFGSIGSLAANSAAELKTTFIKQELDTFILPNNIKEEKIPEKLEFEPYHTVDYFAAVGIKIDDKLLQNDRIGQQLRSFNDWLKTMKNLHPEKLLENNLPETQGLVEIKTLDDEEVITEAMAIVYLKQGRKDKAVELLAKLSLLNSSKTTYFANLIQEYNNK